MSFLTSSGGVVMNNEDMKSIFDQINNLKNLLQNPKKQMLCMKGYFREVLNGISEEIQRVLDEMISHRKIYVG